MVRRRIEEKQSAEACKRKGAKNGKLKDSAKKKHEKKATQGKVSGGL